MKPLNPHPATTIAKIQQGKLRAKPAPEAIEVLSPTPDKPRSSVPDQKSLVGQMHKVMQVDVKSTRLATWWNKGQVEGVARLITAKTSVLDGLTSLRTKEKELMFEEDSLALSRREVELKNLLKTNEMEVARQATAMGVPVAMYGDYMLKLLEGQITAQTKIFEAEVQTETERISLEETIKVSLKRASLAFENEKRLIKELTGLEEILHDIDAEQMPPNVKRNKKKRIRQLISVKDAELRASQQETLSAGNGRKLRRASQEASDTPEPQE